MHPLQYPQPAPTSSVVLLYVFSTLSPGFLQNATGVLRDVYQESNMATVSKLDDLRTLLVVLWYYFTAMVQMLKCTTSKHVMCR